MNIHNLIKNSAQIHPEKNAVWYCNRWMTYGDIDALSNSLGNYLKRQGILRGDRVALLYENSFNYIICYYAILKIGAVTVALNTETTVDSLHYLLNDSGAKAIISNQRFYKVLIKAITNVPALKLMVIDQDDIDELKSIAHLECTTLNDVLEHDFHNPDVRCIDADLASIVYTSGSTGKPKGVMLSHLNVVTNTKSIIEYLQLTRDDRIMVVLPFYYIYGKSLLNTHFYAGGSVVIDNRFAYPNVILKTMAETEITGFSGVPSTFMILLHRSALNSYKFATLRYVTQAGGAMAPHIQKQVANIFHPAKLYIMYGATEASARLSYLNPDMLPQKWGSIGKAIPNVDLFVADESGIEVDQGDVGELVARGSNIMNGYWNDPDETNRVLRHGLYYTGDLGKMDEDGFLYVVGRKKDMIKVGGERISAKEIEEVILELEYVTETAVIGVPDELLGEAIKAFIVCGNSLSEDEIKLYLQDKLPTFKHPKYLEFCNSLPKNKSGKILKSQLE
ncbi:acyl--CoA ligase [candidate division KSB1 bacterium]|nr:acyl--CoA ligase [candidate division KSB1 bacterium]